MYRISDKLKKISKIIVFSIIFTAIFAFLSQGFIPSDSENEDGMESRISRAYRGEPKNTVDVVFIGNSDIYRGISPVDLYHATGITSAIAGEPGKKFSHVNKDIKDILKYQKPKAVVLETDCMFSEKSPAKTPSEHSLVSSSVIGAKNAFLKCTSLLRQAKQYAKQGDNALIAAINYKYPLIKYHDNYINLKLSDFFNPLRKYSFYNKGMAYSDKVKAYEGGRSYMDKGRGLTADADPEMEQKLKAIVETCRKNDIELILTTVPSANTWNDSKHRIVQSLADKYHLTYYDYNTDFPDAFDWKTDSTDGGNHLNYSGARKVTHDMADKLSNEIGIAPSEISENDKERWDSDYSTFHDRIAHSSQKKNQHDKTHR